MCETCERFEEDSRRFHFSLYLARLWMKEAPEDRRFEAAQNLRSAELALRDAENDLQAHQCVHIQIDKRYTATG